MRERELQQQPGSETEHRQIQQRNQDIQQSSIRERVGEQLAKSADILAQAKDRLDELQKQHQKLTASQGTEAKEPKELEEGHQEPRPDADSRELTELERKISQEQNRYGLLEDRIATLKRIENLPLTMGPRLQELANELLRRYEQNKDLAGRRIVSLGARIEQFQRAALEQMQNDLQQQDPVKALRDVEERLKDCEDHGHATKEMAAVRNILSKDSDPAAQRKQLCGLLKDFEERNLIRKSFETQDDLKRMQNTLQQPDSEKALQDIEPHIKDCEARGFAPKEMADLRAVLGQATDPAAKRDELNMLLEDFEKRGLMSRGVTIADVKDLAAVWEMAQDRVKNPNDYNAVRNEFWKLLHPDTKLPISPLAKDEEKKDINDANKAIERGREFIKAAGYSFEDSKPGRAPRLVSERPLSRNDYTLSLQHDLMQKNIRSAEVDRLLTDPRYLRFVTTRDNLQEDSVRARDLTDLFRERAQINLEALEDFGKEAQSELSDVKLQQRFVDFQKEARERLSHVGDWERQALREQRSSFNTLRQLRTQMAIEKGKLEKAKDQPPRHDSPEFSREQERQPQLEQHIAQLEYENELAERSIIQQMADAHGALDKQVQQARERALEEQLKERASANEAWKRLLRELEDRIQELEWEVDLPPK